MRGSWVTTFAVGGVTLLLTLFLGLQYNWLSQASEAERERVQRRVEADAKSFADDFNREMQAAFFNFQTDAKSWEKQDWTEFNERYDFWRSRTQYPELIRDFYYFPNGDAKPLRYDAQARAFVPAAEVPEGLTKVRASSEGDRWSPFHEDEYALAMPVHDAEHRFERIHIQKAAAEPPVVKMPERKGLLIIALDREVITGRILPDLAAKHFPEGNFRVSVRNRSDAAVYESAGPVSGSDASAGLLSLTPDNMIFFTESSALISKVRTEKAPAAMVRERVESKTFTHSETGPDGMKTGTYTIQLRPGGPPQGNGVTSRRSVFASSSQDGDPWKLAVQHAAGSVDAFARGEFNKSFAIGFGLYLVLVGAILAIVLSALRSKRFAQRQIDFVSSVSHEFRTPLAVIYSASENLVDGVASDREQVTRYGSLIKGEGRKLSAMVEQILQFAGANSGRKKYNFTETDVSAVVESAVSACGPILDEKGFEIECSIAENLPRLRVDPEAVSTALQNLISNSVKYSNGSRWIGLKAVNGGGTVKISIEDRGIGIAGEDLRRIFEPFYRARNVVDAQIHGNGLGLALVKQISEAHGGKVWARSESGKGSEFTIELPVPKA